MQIVIEIPDIFVEWAKDEMSVEIFNDRGMADAMSSAIRNGIVLPRGHGDLIDRSKIGFDYWSVDGYVCVGKKYIFNMPVIVPADTEVK